MARRVFVSLAALTLLAGCGKSSASESRAETAAVNTTGAPAVSAGASSNADQDTAGYRPLFDGTSLAGWHVYHGTGTGGWQNTNGIIERGKGGGDLVTDSLFANFDLALEWKVPPGGNSGVIYRIDDSGDATYMTGPEMQVLDDAKHLDGKNPLTSAGAVYGLYPAPRGIVKPAGEWNSARVVANGNHVEHWLNGTRIAEYTLGSPDWEQKVAASKFKEWKGYGKFARGRIALQDHGDQVSFRNVRIRVLP
jgi:hypothetical protein